MTLQFGSLHTLNVTQLISSYVKRIDDIASMVFPDTVKLDLLLLSKWSTQYVRQEVPAMHVILSLWEIGLKVFLKSEEVSSTAS